MVTGKTFMKTATPLVAAAALMVAACAQESAPRAVPAAAPIASHQPSISIGAAGPLEPRPPRTPASYNSVNTSRPVVALTFDDGPHPEFTPRLLDILRHEGVRATFYVIGRSVQTYPEIARRIVAEGHEIANHSWSHPRLTALSASRLKTEMANTSDIIQKVTGRRPTNMRPPYGAINERVRQAIYRDHGLDVIMWSVDPLDWKRPGAEVVRRRMVDGATPGGILLAHDIHPGTIDAMSGTIKDLKAKGYGFATVSQLLALQDHQSAPRTAAPVAQEQQTVVR
jgi:peptidoglycan/xylan/chitin deacetylase (PgdA/CDA1 family)